MDNGLIFPYPRKSVPNEPHYTNHPSRVVSSETDPGTGGILVGSS